MKTRLIIEGNAVYEIDEECMECKRRSRGGKAQSGEKKPDGVSNPASSAPENCSDILR